MWSNKIMKSDQQQADEAKRILRQVARETDPSAFPVLDRLQDHLSANDSDQNDKIEVWGTRIGRGLGLFIMIFLLLSAIVWFGAMR
jgi:hypothetical protein